MEIETIKLSEKAKHQLISIKRKTGIENWNVLCRWAFCLSLAEPTAPPKEDIPSDSSVEMTWRTFGGDYADVYSALLRLRAHRDRISHDEIPAYFRILLHRGISYLAQRQFSGIEDLFSTLKPRARLVESEEPA